MTHADRQARQRVYMARYKARHPEWTVYQAAYQDAYKPRGRAVKAMQRRAAGKPMRRCPHCFGMGHAERCCPDRSAA